MNASGPLSCVDFTPRSARRRAFSLVELGLVILIIAVMAVIAAPRYANALAHYRVDLAVQRIMADISLARARARGASRTWSVSFNDAEDTYAIYDGTTLVSATDVTKVDLTAAPYHATITTPVFGADAILIFDGYGVPDSDGEVIIESGGFQTTIKFNGNTNSLTVSSKEIAG